MTTMRAAKLDALGFAWEADRTARKPGKAARAAIRQQKEASVVQAEPDGAVLPAPPVHVGSDLPAYLRAPPDLYHLPAGGNRPLVPSNLSLLQRDIAAVSNSFAASQ
jgi:hypothetical protein